MASTIATIMKALGKLRKKPKKTEADRKEIRQLEREKDQINKAEKKAIDMRKAIRKAPKTTGTDYLDPQFASVARLKNKDKTTKSVLPLSKTDKKQMKLDKTLADYIALPLSKKEKIIAGARDKAGPKMKVFKSFAGLKNVTEKEIKDMARKMSKKDFMALSDADMKKIPDGILASIIKKYDLVKSELKKGGTMMKKKGMARGGMKKKGMARGGMKKKGMARGGMKKKGMAMGGLKKPAANQTGLKKLPTTVRNKMGYAKNGGMMKKKGMAKGGMKKKGYAAGGMTVRYKVGGMAKGKMYGSVDNRKKK
jgi:hypothetical protein